MEAIEVRYVYVTVHGHGYGHPLAAGEGRDDLVGHHDAHVVAARGLEGGAERPDRLAHGIRRRSASRALRRASSARTCAKMSRSATSQAGISSRTALISSVVRCSPTPPRVRPELEMPSRRAVSWRVCGSVAAQRREPLRRLGLQRVELGAADDALLEVGRGLGQQDAELLRGRLGLHGLRLRRGHGSSLGRRPTTPARARPACPRPVARHGCRTASGGVPVRTVGRHVHVD